MYSTVPGCARYIDHSITYPGKVKCSAISSTAHDMSTSIDPIMMLIIHVYCEIWGNQLFPV